MKFKIGGILIVLLLTLGSSVWAQTEPTAPKTEAKAPVEMTVEAQVCTAVTDREPSGTASSFDAGVGSLYCWCRIVGMKGEANIKHVWFRDGKDVLTVELAVKTSSFRTWSQKNIPASGTGNWEVKIVDAADTVLKTVSFTVGGESKK